VRARRIGNLLNLSTPLGVLLARVGRARIRGGPHGLLLAEGVRLPFPDAGAMTIGDVVLTTGRFADLVSRFPRVLDHEARHADQWLRWGGLPFIPAYLLGAGWSLVTTRDRAAGNPFERAAGLADGGYAAPAGH
jgi:hypothetical protein